MYTITKEFHWEMAHILTNHTGLCGNLHGHSYKMYVTLTSVQLGEVRDNGMIIDFTNLKKFIQEEIDLHWDHVFAYNIESNDPFEIEIAKTVGKYQKRLLKLNFRTTAENMSYWWYTFINEKLKELYPFAPTIKCKKVQLFETASGSATYEGSTI